MSLPVPDRAAVLRTVRVLTAEVPAPTRHIQRLRPYICPFEQVVARVPPGGRVLDVGCGSGTLLALLARHAGIAAGVGYDLSARAVAAAKRLGDDRLRFHTAAQFAARPFDRFDAVTMVDVLHHVPPDDQQDFVRATTRRVAPGGLLVYKDMRATDAAARWWNRCHDLLMARQWIHYRPVETVMQWCLAEGLFPIEQSRYRCLRLYDHDLLVARRPCAQRHAA